MKIDTKLFRFCFVLPKLLLLFTIVLILPIASHAAEKINTNHFSPDSHHILHYFSSSIDTLSTIKFEVNIADEFSLLFAKSFSELLNELCDTNVAKRSDVSKKIIHYSSLISKKALRNWSDSLPQIREEIAAYFNSNFVNIMALNDKDFFSKYRFYKYMTKHEELAKWFDEWGLNDTSHLLLKSIQFSYYEYVNSCQYELLFPKSLSNASSTLTLLLNNIFKNADELFLFSSFLWIKPKIDTLWMQPYFTEGFYRYSYLNLTKNPDAPRVHVPENMIAVMHKVRTALKDALWIEEPASQLGYIFQDENISISQADSLIISTAIFDFGIKTFSPASKKGVQ